MRRRASRAMTVVILSVAGITGCSAPLPFKPSPQASSRRIIDDTTFPFVDTQICDPQMQVHNAYRIRIKRANPHRSASDISKINLATGKETDIDPVHLNTAQDTRFDIWMTGSRGKYTKIIVSLNKKNGGGQRKLAFYGDPQVSTNPNTKHPMVISAGTDLAQPLFCVKQSYKDPVSRGGYYSPQDNKMIYPEDLEFYIKWPDVTSQVDAPFNIALVTEEDDPTIVDWGADPNFHTVIVLDPAVRNEG